MKLHTVPWDQRRRTRTQRLGCGWWLPGSSSMAYSYLGIKGSAPGYKGLGVGGSPQAVAQRLVPHPLVYHNTCTTGSKPLFCRCAPSFVLEAFNNLSQGPIRGRGGRGGVQRASETPPAPRAKNPGSAPACPQWKVLLQ